MFGLSIFLNAEYLANAGERTYSRHRQNFPSHSETIGFTD